MSPATDGDDVLGRLTDELTAALLAGEAIDDAQWAARFAVAVADVAACRRALLALERALGEEPACGAPELPRPELPGYTIEAELGRGGMGVVYRAQQQQLGRAVAIKVLRPGDLTFGDALARFRSEAKSLARLRHRHIVSVHDIGETRDGLLWFAMDLIEGETLAAEIRRRGALLPARATKVLRQVTSAIAHAHAQGVVHRDLKPHNVLIDRHGDAFVVDFGLARDAASVSVHTIQGQLLGTPEYMSPEQARGDVARIGEASDVWALGALLYECLGGRGPFAGLPLHATIRAILDDEPRPLRSLDARVPGPLAAVAGKALQKRPQDRYGSALAFGEELERFAQGDPVLAKPPSRAVVWARRAWRQRRSAAVVGAAVGAVILFFTHFLLPDLRREAVLAAADTAIRDGFPGAAVAPLQELRATMVAAHAVATDDPVLVRCEQALLQALVDRAGELLLAGRREAAIEVAQQAYRATSGARMGTGWLAPDMQWQTWRAANLSTVLQSRVTIDVPRPLQDRLVAALGSPGTAERHVAQQLAMACGRMDWLAGAGDDVVIPLLLTMHEVAAARLREAHFMMLPEVLWRGTTFPLRWSRRQVVEALAASLARRASDADFHRVVLGSMFRAFGLPAEYWLDRDGPRWADDGGLLQAARAWRDTLVFAASAPPAAALAAMHERMAASLLAAEDLPGSPTAGELRRLVATWTGHRGRTPTAAVLRQWFAEHGRRPPDAWLHACVDDPASRTLSPTGLLARACRAEDPAVAFAWWQLLRLRRPDVVDMPLVPPPNDEGLSDWRREWLRALGVEDVQRFSVQMALLHFRDGAPEPELSATGVVEARVGSPFVGVAQTRPVVPALHVAPRRLFPFPPPAHRPDAPEVVPLVTGEVRGIVRGVVKEDRDGVLLSLESSDGGRVQVDCSLPGQRVSGHAGIGEPTLRLGHAASGEHDYVLWQEDQRWSDFVLLVRLAPAGEPAPTELAVWRQSFVAHMHDAERRAFRGASLDFSTASLWPMPEGLEALRACRSLWRQPLGWSLALAGEPGDPSHWPVPEHGRASALVRMALGSADQAQRLQAVAALAAETAPLPAGPAATLLRAQAAGQVELPEPLQERVRASVAAGPRASQQAVWGLLFVVAMVVGFSVRWRGGRFAAVGAFVGLVCSCRLLFANVSVAGVCIVPTGVALAGILAGLWLAPLARGLWWRGVVGATAALLVLSALWESGIVLVPLRELSLDGWLIVLVGLTLLQSLVGESGSRVTSRRRVATSPAP